MKIFRFKRMYLLLLLLPAWGLNFLAARFPDITETYFSSGIYPVIAGIFGRIVSFFPFSVFELAIIGALAVIFYLCVRFARKRRRTPVVIGKGPVRPDFLKIIATVVAVASCLVSAFGLFCALNYHRYTFAQLSGLDVHPSSAGELALMTRGLAEKANELHARAIQTNDNGLARLPVKSNYALAQKAQRLYSNAAEHYPILSGYVARPKPPFLSRIMSLLQISGVYVAPLFEPNVNADIVPYMQPVIMMHEISHFKGFMREDEANFIAYLTCKYSGDDEFHYSGTMLALVHSLNALYSADRDAYREIYDMLCEDVCADFAANDAYWKQFEGPVGEVSTAVNDVYLRVNRQSNGVKSYGEMVDLLLAEYRAAQA